jgi:outer membrane receptor protein involved in Fe transport
VAPLPSVCDSSLGAVGLTSPPTQVNPDNVKNYEIGTKTEWLDKRLAVNLSVYFIDWNGIQQQLYLQCGEYIYANAGKALSRGAELEIPAQITERLAAGVSASYTKATLSSAQPAFQALAGDQINNVPVWQAAAHADYSFPVTDSIHAVARLDAQYTGSSYAGYNRLGDGERDPMYYLDSLTLLNSRFELTRGDWSAALFADNMLDRISREGLQNSLIANVPGRPRYVPNRPRTFGINFRRSF